MERVFVVSVRLHQGRYHGLDQRQECEWPPSPARLFQALLAGSAHGDVVPEATLAALKWLESLPPPSIAAPRGTFGQAYTSYVPNNDLDATLAGKRLEDGVAKTRVAKRSRPTLFDVSGPLLYCWTFDTSDGDYTSELCKAAKDLYQLGRGIDMAVGRSGSPGR